MYKRRRFGTGLIGMHLSDNYFQGNQMGMNMNKCCWKEKCIRHYSSMDLGYRDLFDIYCQRSLLGMNMKKCHQIKMNTCRCFDKGSIGRHWFGKYFQSNRLDMNMKKYR